MNPVQRVRQFVRRHALFNAETRVLVALSGGSDSVALATILRELDASGEVRLVGAAHFNHQLREAASQDEEFSAGVARLLGVSYVVDGEDVRDRARRERRSIEDAARRARYEFFERARRQLDADVVALGHTRDDQAETFLLRLLRGAGPRGLAAMYPGHGTIVRPVLDCRRAELRTYLDERKMTYVDDETNEDVSIPRNRIRAELMPFLQDRFNPAIVDVLANEAELARETWAWLENAANDFETGFAEKTPDGVFELDIARLLAAELSLRRLVVWRAMKQMAGGRSVSFDHVDAALRLLDGDGGTIDMPGHFVQRIGSRLVLTSRQPGRDLGAPVNLFEYPLSIPGEVHLLETGCVVAAELQTAQGGVDRSARSGEGPVAMVRRDLVGGPLAVRNRRPGDKFTPIGVEGRKKLQDYFVDRKVARGRRDSVPLVVDRLNRIVWVAGYAIDEAFRVTEPSQSVLLLRLKVGGGSA